MTTVDTAGCMPPRHQPRFHRIGFTLIELLVVIAVIGVLVGLLLPAIQAARESARRSSCSNNLKQLALACRNYESSMRTLPLALDKSKFYSWAPLVLPFLEEATRVASYDISVGWWLPKPSGAGGNRDIVGLPLAVTQCPSTPSHNRMQDKPETAKQPGYSVAYSKRGACGDYFATAGLHAVSINANNFLGGARTISGDTRGVLCWYSDGTKAANADLTNEGPGNTSNRLEDVTDGLSQSILFAECAGREDAYRGRTKYAVDYTGLSSGGKKIRARGGAWATTDNAYMIGSILPWDASFSTVPIPRGAPAINNSNEWGHCFYAFHPTGANVAMADGAVRWLAQDTPLDLLCKLVTRAGMELQTTP